MRIPRSETNEVHEILKSGKSHSEMAIEIYRIDGFYLANEYDGRIPRRMTINQIGKAIDEYFKGAE